MPTNKNLVFYCEVPDIKNGGLKAFKVKAENYEEVMEQIIKATQLPRYEINIQYVSKL